MIHSRTLTGRDDELAATAALIDHISRDGAALLWVGEPGVGKTALLQMARNLAEHAGHQVLTATGHEFDTADSFSALRRLLLPLRRSLTDLPAPARDALSMTLAATVGPTPSHEVLCAASLTLLGQAAQSQPILIMLDDAQWIDHASASVLAFVARRLAGTRVGFLAAMRTGSVSPLVQAALPEREITPLNADAARELLASHWPTLTEQVATRVLSEAMGLPLALLELPVGLSGSQRTGLNSLPSVLPVGSRLSGLFASRIRALPEPTLRVLLIAALQGTDGDLAIIRAAARHDPTLTHLATAERAGLVKVDDEHRQLAFRHPLVRSTVVHSAPPETRRSAHLALAAASRGHPGRAVWHLAEGTTGTDEQVAAILERHAVATLALGDAVGATSFLHRAADLSADPPSKARRQIHAAFIGADVTGDLAGAAALLKNADQVEPALTGSLAATVTASYLLLNAECDVDTAHRLLVAAIESYPGRYNGSDPVLVDALHTLVMLCWFGGRPALWHPFRTALKRLGAETPSSIDLCHRAFGDPTHQAPAALPAIVESLDALRREADPLRITRLALAGVYTDRLGTTREALRRVIDDGRSGGAVALAINALVSSCVDNWLTGQWDEAVELAAEGVRLSEKHGYRRYSVILGGYINQLVRVARGDYQGGDAAADEMARWAADRGARMSLVFASHVRLLRALAREDYEDAYRHACVISLPGSLPRYAPHALWVLFDLVDAAVHTGRHDEATSHVTEMKRLNIAALSPRLAMVSTGSAAMAANDGDATELYEEALAVADGQRWPFDRAKIQLAYGEHLRHQRDPAAARKELREALSTFDQLGARPWTARTARELRAVGEASHQTSEPLRPALSPGELRVAQLAGVGLTNRQIGAQLFMSHRSVGAALYRIFPKLGVTSRAELHHALANLPDAPAVPADQTPEDPNDVQ